MKRQAIIIALLCAIAASRVGFVLAEHMAAPMMPMVHCVGNDGCGSSNAGNAGDAESSAAECAAHCLASGSAAMQDVALPIAYAFAFGCALLALAVFRARTASAFVMQRGSPGGTASRFALACVRSDVIRD